ncbi:MAG TPA: glycosyltransferase family protein [Saprospiraceae bacterium]|nr:glycosyltransferase family protein [Saprospiraceae bacterium]
MIEPAHKKILYCVLNWGLGHATRSIPVIRALQAKGYEVEIASDGGPLTFLRKTFPDCQSHALQGYNITYPTSSVFLNAISQLRNMFRAVSTERRQIAALVTQHKYSAIISDNRYGCYHPSIPSILITHQLRNLAQTSLMSKPGEWLVNGYLRHFDEIWIPDTPDRMLSGKLTDVSMKKVRFIGHLSDQVYSPMEKQNDIAAILSGPEPQRTKLEEEILPQLANYPGKCVLVQGLITHDPPRQEGNVTIYPYLDRPAINMLLNSSEVILCRTGYSSLMDLLQVGAKAILIPTPGQPEQIYLGERMQEYEQFVVQKQGGVDVVEGIEHLKNQVFMHEPEQHTEILEIALRSLKRTNQY